MRKKKELRNKTLTVHIPASEQAALKARFRETTYRMFSDFIRGHLRQEPVVRKIRNQSLDDLLQTLIAIKHELEAAQNSFAQAVQALKIQPPDDIQKQVLDFLLAEQWALNAHIATIKDSLIQLYAKCSQEQSPSQK